MAVDPGIFGPASLGMTQAIAQFQTFLPSFTEIRKADPNEDAAMVQDVRMGELAAVLLTLGIGGMVSSLTGSPVPAVVSAVTCFGLVCLYESALRAMPKEA